MRVLVTGATGFIGSHVVPELLARGHDVRVLARASADVSLLPAAIQTIRGELDDAAHAVAGVEALVHLAGTGGGLLRLGDRIGHELRAVNVEGTRRVFQAAHRAGVRRAVLVTSMWTVLRPDLASKSAYLASRLDSERAALAESDKRLETVVLCPTFVVGARDRGPNLPGALIVAFLRGLMPLVPAAGMTWIAARDTARMIAAALEHGDPGRRYLVGAEHRSHREFFTRVARKAGLRPPMAAIPKPLLRLAGTGGDLLLAAVGRRAPIPLHVGVDLLCADAPFDCTPAWYCFGEPTVRVDDALDEAIAWFREHGYVRFHPNPPASP